MGAWETLRRTIPLARLSGWQLLPYGNGAISDQPVSFLENDLPTWWGLERWAKWQLDREENIGIEATVDEEFAFDLFGNDDGKIFTLEDLRRE